MHPLSNTHLPPTLKDVWILTRQHTVTSSVFQFGASILTQLFTGYRLCKSFISYTNLANIHICVLSTSQEHKCKSWRDYTVRLRSHYKLQLLFIREVKHSCHDNTTQSSIILHSTLVAMTSQSLAVHYSQQ
jgi:hypothetical protein